MQTKSWNLKREITRKIIHLLSIVFIIIFLIISKIYNKSLALLTLVFLLIIFFYMEYARIELKRRIPFFWKCWRKEEEDTFGGQIFFLAAVIICLAVFDFRIALVAILMTALGDPTAAIVGKKFGKTLFLKEKTLEGVLAELVINLIIAYIVTQNLTITLVMAISATGVETLTYRINDNLIIPIFSGFNGQLVLLVLRMIR